MMTTTAGWIFYGLFYVQLIIFTVLWRRYCGLKTIVGFNEIQLTNCDRIIAAQEEIISALDPDAVLRKAIYNRATGT